MAQNRRQPRRQGVVYGPPRQGRYTENGVFIGRFLGLGILLLALGALAAGALAFVGDKPAATATRSAGVSPSLTLRPRTQAPTLTATVGSTANPTAIPTALSPTQTPPVVTPAATVAVTFAPPLVQIGEGFVTFGTQVDDQLHITDPRSSFTMQERIVWSAYLTRRADTVDLLMRIFKLDPSVEGGERLIAEESVTPVVSNVQILGNRIRPDAKLDGPGIYVVRYVRNEDILSEGSFEVTG